MSFFGDKFHKENLHFRGRNFSEWLNLMQGFISVDKKLSFFWKRPFKTNPSKQIQTEWHSLFIISSSFSFLRDWKKLANNKEIYDIPFWTGKWGVPLETVHNQLFYSRFAQNIHEWFIKEIITVILFWGSDLPTMLIKINIVFKTDSAQSSSIKCKNYLLKIYLQHINVLNTI